MGKATADLYDEHGEHLRVLAPIFNDYGGVTDFEGSVATLKVHEDNSLVRAALEEPGNGKVLVIDGGGSTRCALVGDLLAALGSENGWAGIVVLGFGNRHFPSRTIDPGWSNVWSRIDWRDPVTQHHQVPRFPLRNGLCPCDTENLGWWLPRTGALGAGALCPDGTGDWSDRSCSGQRHDGRYLCCHNWN